MMEWRIFFSDDQTNSMLDKGIKELKSHPSRYDDKAMKSVFLKL